MKKIFKNTRSFYFTLIIMLVVVTSLISISFSYYVDDSSNTKQYAKVEGINNIISSDQLNDNYLTLAGNTEETITVNVISNNDFTSSFKLSYETTSDVSVTAIDSIDDTIDAHDVLSYKIKVKNNSNNTAIIKFDIVSGYVDTTFNITGTEIK